MREIRFRGKRVDNGEWVYGSLIRKYAKPHKVYIPFGYRIEVNDDEVYPVIPETVGQYTGLKDKNGKEIGKEIYEGDIIKTLNGEIGVINFGFYVDADVLDENKVDADGEKRSDYGWYVKLKKECYGLDNRTDKWIEVIGTIYDNPELLGDTNV